MAGDAFKTTLNDNVGLRLLQV